MRSDQNFEDFIRKNIDQKLDLITSENFTNQLMEKVYLKKISLLKNEKSLDTKKIVIIILGAIVAWFIILTGLSKSGLLSGVITFVTDTLGFFNISQLKYLAIGFIAHFIVVRMLIAIPFLIKKKTLSH